MGGRECWCFILGWGWPRRKKESTDTKITKNIHTYIHTYTHTHTLSFVLVSQRTSSCMIRKGTRLLRDSKGHAMRIHPGSARRLYLQFLSIIPTSPVEIHPQQKHESPMVDSYWWWDEGLVVENCAGVCGCVSVCVMRNWMGVCVP